MMRVSPREPKRRYRSRLRTPKQLPQREKYRMRKPIPQPPLAGRNGGNRRKTDRDRDGEPIDQSLCIPARGLAGEGSHFSPAPTLRPETIQIPERLFGPLLLMWVGRRKTPIGEIWANFPRLLLRLPRAAAPGVDSTGVITNTKLLNTPAKSSLFGTVMEIPGNCILTPAQKMGISRRTGATWPACSTPMPEIQTPAPIILQS